MIRLFNAKLLRKKSDQYQVTSGELWIDGGHICCVQDASAPSFVKPQFEQELDCNGDLLMPGFADMHTHTPMVFLRSLAENLPLQEWLTQAVFPNEALLTTEDVYIFSELAMLEYLRNGITSIFDMYHMDEETAKAAEKFGMRLLVCGNINDFTGSVEENEAKLRRQKMQYQDPMADFRLGCHAEYTCSIEQLKMLSRLCHEWQMPVYAHMSETKQEVSDCIKRYGVSPVQLFEQLGLFDFGGGIFHGVHLLDTDYEILRRRNVGIISNPASNLKLASGIADILRWKKEGIRFGLGTDGAASNNSLDMFKEMFLAASLQKIACGNPAALSAEEILQAAISDGLQICGLATDLNSDERLTEGAPADLCLINLHLPNMQPQTDLINHLVYSAGTANVRMTMINGRICYLDGHYGNGIDPEAIYLQANDQLQALLARRQKQRKE